MKWRDGKRSENIEDRRFQTRTSGVNLQVLIPIIRYLLATKFGRVVLLVGIVAMFLGFNPLSILGVSSGSNPAYNVNQEKDNEAAEFASVVLGETEAIWTNIFKTNGAKYVEPNLVLFRGGVNSACGFASSQVGPFYCPADMKVYLDLGFFDELAKRHDAPGDFASAYVIAHEVGHHVENLIGLLNKAQKLKNGQSQTKQNEIQVGVELVADCYAGIWAHHVKNLLEEGDIEEALNAASMIGDDTLQKKAYGRVMPDSFTHGTAKQRKSAFYSGFKGGTLDSCKAYF